MANKILDRFFRAIDYLLSIALYVIFVEVVVEVSARYIFSVPIPWGSELSQTLLVWITFLGSAVAMRQGEHLAIRFIRDITPWPFLKRGLEILGNLFLIAFLIVGMWSGYLVVARTWGLKTTVLQIPAGILYLAFPVGCFFMILGLCQFLIANRHNVNERV
ncbi:TRAP transporter small permease [Acetomicrobium sp. UBA5826]|uniref:TRAP transporter small permease n=1 Tax=Acetomicrobium sp. UBA5826 TaxID=1946039 RepID=UPI00257DFD31|nr:TRAP transporter small permease [Acetomicrobium sp. UBA5826]